MNNETLLQIIKYFGTGNQKVKAIEELSELSKAIAKDMTDSNPDNRMCIIEEMADVEIMLAQLKIIYGITDTGLDAEKEYKINRTLARMNEEMPE